MLILNSKYKMNTLNNMKGYIIKDRNTSQVMLRP